MLRKLHHNAYRCRDSEETRGFYEDFLGLRLAGSLEISETKTGRGTSVLHTFYEMEDGSYLAFFEDPGTPFEFKPQRDFDLHIALEVDPTVLQPMLDKGHAAGIETHVHRRFFAHAQNVAGDRAPEMCRSHGIADRQRQFEPRAADRVVVVPGGRRHSVRV